MGLFNIFSGTRLDTTAEQRSLSLFNTDPLPPMHYYGISDEAVVQGSDNAMAVSAFHACVRAISDAVSGLPWNVYKRDDDGNTPHKASASLLCATCVITTRKKNSILPHHL